MMVVTRAAVVMMMPFQVYASLFATALRMEKMTSLKAAGTLASVAGAIGGYCASPLLVLSFVCRAKSSRCALSVAKDNRGLPRTAGAPAAAGPEARPVVWCVLVQ
jgi:hypothetical protein